MGWSDFECAAPRIAGTARERFDATRVALLGTVRVDGSPRISPVEPYFAAGQLLFGAMAWSRKATDLLRDPRLVLCSTVAGPDTGVPEVRLYGEAALADAATRASCRGGWWIGEAEAAARVFAVSVTEATVIEWNLAGADLMVTTWSPASGVRTRQRPYP